MSLRFLIGMILLHAGFLIISCKPEPSDRFVWKDLEVTVTAYNSVHWQTDGDPQLTAWGDTLRPGARWIAVSRDLIPLGLRHNTEVRIEGLDGTYLVKDKMNRRFSRHVDLYMGEDITSAREWGRQKRTISYRVPVDSLKSEDHEAIAED